MIVALHLSTLREEQIGPDPKMRRIILTVILFSLALLQNGGPAHADSVYTLNYDSCSGGCGNGQGTSNNSFGYVDLKQISSNQVSVTLDITNPSYIVNT